MNEIKLARERLGREKPDIIVSELVSQTGFERGIVLFGLSIDALIERSINESVRNVEIGAVPSGIVDDVRGEMWRLFSSRYASWEGSELQLLSLYLMGHTTSEAAKEVGLEPRAVADVSQKRGFLGERRWLLDEISGQVSDYVNIDIKVEAQLRPIVKKLGRKALEGLNSDELTPKESLKAFQDLGRLLAQVTGELVDKKQIEIGPTEQFMEIMNAAKQMKGEVIEAKEYRLIE